MKSLYLIAIAVLFTISCTRDTPSTEPTRSELQASSSEDTKVTPAVGAICPQAWTCDYLHWYGTEAACTTQCAPTCELDFRCGRGCLCP